jgi:hypothetical protein
MRKLSGLLAALAVVVLLLGACGDETSSADALGADAPRTGSADEIVCEGQPRAGVALDPQAAACADNGFEPQVDVFAFENFGGTGTLDATGMVALFGPESVCAEGAGEGCTLFPAARAWLEQVNQAMSAGRCEGMAVVAARLEEGGEPVSMLQSGAQATVDLLQETESVVGEIEYWWATQVVPEVAEPTAQVRALQPSEVVATLIQGLMDGTGYTLGMYSDAGGHAVTPFAVSQSTDGTLDIAIYDNNYPTVISHVIVDPSAETWTYDMGATNPSVEASAWTGTGPGTLDLTAMDWRSGPFAAPFADSEGASTRGDVSRTFLVTAGLKPGEGSVGAQITVGGVSIDTTSGVDEALSLPEGVVVTPIKASGGGRGTVVGVQITAPSSIGEVSVTPLVKRNPAALSGEGTSRRIVAAVSVDAPGQPRVTVAAPSAAQGDQVILTSAGNGSTRVKAGGARALASIATGRASVTIPVPRSGEIEVGDDEGGQAEVLIIDEDGEEYVVNVEGLTEGEIVELVATLADGEWTLEPWTGEEGESWTDSEWLAEEDSWWMEEGDGTEDSSGADEGSSGGSEDSDSGEPGDASDADEDYSGADEDLSGDAGDSSGADEDLSGDAGDPSGADEDPSDESENSDSGGSGDE